MSLSFNMIMLGSVVSPLWCELSSIEIIDLDSNKISASMMIVLIGNLAFQDTNAPLLDTVDVMVLDRINKWWYWKHWQGGCCHYKHWRGGHWGSVY